MTHDLCVIKVTAVREIKVRDTNAGETTPNQRRLKLRVRNHLSRVQLESKWYENAIIDKTVPSQIIQNSFIHQEIVLN